ncbi:hypothetical protein [Hydrogenoanaerobacterium sp.]|uniref:hypothetical protein n=1 Tax=Hydrogenoanaerobacterium sp. TaxID=2953763 RepID=UPI0028992814|nr:hypothetical protein [Hydrogenoanaerobacterium sp.]
MKSSLHCLPKEIQQQLCVIDQSQFYIIVIIAAVFLSLHATSIQRQQLICSVTQEDCCKCLPDVFPIRFLSSVMILIALVFFFQLSGENLCKPQPNCVARCSGKMNHVASLLVLLAAAIRFFDINFVELNTPRKPACP